MEVIQFVDPTGQTLVARVPRQGTAAIQPDSELVVEEGQQAVFLRDGAALDVFGPGRHALAASNLPLLSEAAGRASESGSLPRAAVLFTSSKTFTGLKWGTPEPVICRDPELGPVELRAYGELAARIDDPRRFVERVAASRKTATSDGLEHLCREVIVARLADVVGAGTHTVSRLLAEVEGLGKELEARTAGDLSKLGLELMDLTVLGLRPLEDLRRRTGELATAGAGKDVETAAPLSRK